MCNFERKQSTSQGGYMVKSTGVICDDGKSATFYTSVSKDTLNKRLAYTDVNIMFTKEDVVKE